MPRLGLTLYLVLSEFVKQQDLGLSCLGPGNVSCVHVFLQHEERVCYQSNLIPPKDMLKFLPPVPINAPLFGNGVFEGIISLRSL